jgi:hypothetical protein
VEVVPPLSIGRGRIGLGKEEAPRRDFPSLVAALLSPSNLYMLEVLALFYLQVLEPPLVHLVLVLVGPS